MKRRNILFLLSVALSSVILWTIFSVIHNSVTSTIPASLNIQTQPIEAHFDKNAIKKAHSRTKTNPQFEIGSPPTPTPPPLSPQAYRPIPTPTATTIPTPTFSPRTNNATSSGGLTP